MRLNSRNASINSADILTRSSPRAWPSPCSPDSEPPIWTTMSPLLPTKARKCLMLFPLPDQNRSACARRHRRSGHRARSGSRIWPAGDAVRADIHRAFPATRPRLPAFPRFRSPGTCDVAPSPDSRLSIPAGFLLVHKELMLADWAGAEGFHQGARFGVGFFLVSRRTRTAASLCLQASMACSWMKVLLLHVPR